MRIEIGLMVALGYGKSVRSDRVARSIIRDQGKWDLDRLEERIKETLAEEEAANVGE